MFYNLGRSICDIYPQDSRVDDAKLRARHEEESIYRIAEEPWKSEGKAYPREKKYDVVLLNTIQQI